MVGDIIRNLENQFDRISKVTTDNLCEYCELAVNCVKSRNSNCIPKPSVGGTEQFAECYIPNRIAYLECGSRSIADGIGDAYKFDPNELKYDFRKSFAEYDFYEINERGWEPVQPVFISAQTGSGKNYFIENTLIPYVKELNYQNRANYKILIISNRLALKKQIKEHLNGKDTLEKEDTNIYSYDKNVNVITYQGLLRQRYILKEQQEGKTNGEKYLYVICDEAHFFTSDAMFNVDTQKILSAVVETFGNAIRIYMSATPYECLSKIYESEEKTYNGDNDSYNYFQLAFYHFNRDYSSINIFTYSEHDELLESISNSVTAHKERWLIFIDNKNQCKDLAKKLESKLLSNDNKKDSKSQSSKVYSVSADDKYDEKFIKIVENEKLDKETFVLISTSVFDNGINLDNVDNVVVSDINTVKCIQMIGRARVRNNKVKNLYMKRFDQKYVNKKISNNDVQIDAYCELDLAFGTNSDIDHIAATEKFFNKYYRGNAEDWENAKHWFGHKYGTFDLYFNSIAKSLAEKRINFYRFVSKKMNHEAECNTYIGQWLLEYQLSWFGKEYRIDNDLTFQDKDKKKKELITFLENHAKNNTIFETESQKNRRTEWGSQAEVDGKYYSQGEFRKKFTELYDAAFGRADKNKERVYSCSKINDLLCDSKLSFKLDNNKNGWTVREYNRGNKNSDGEK